MQNQQGLFKTWLVEKTELVLFHRLSDIDWDKNKNKLISLNRSVWLIHAGQFLKGDSMPIISIPA